MKKFTCAVKLVEHPRAGWYGVIEAETPEQAANVARDRHWHSRKARATSDKIEHVEVRALPTDEFLGEF